MAKRHFVIATPIGGYQINLVNGVITKITPSISEADQLSILSEQEKEIHAQFQSYFQNGDFRFTLPIAPPNNEFQRQFRAALSKIPAGETLSYGDIARQLATSPRAIGQACRRNPLPIVIPCHRVVAQHHIGGYSGHQKGRILDKKRWLQEHEKAALALEV